MKVLYAVSYQYTERANDPRWDKTHENNAYSNPYCYVDSDQQRDNSYSRERKTSQKGYPSMIKFRFGTEPCEQRTSVLGYVRILAS